VSLSRPELVPKPKARGVFAQPGHQQGDLNLVEKPQLVKAFQLFPGS
jgi:hypothetical protein